MKKPTLLYISPFWPMKSGISEYSEALLEGLAELFEITLLTDDYKIESEWLKKKFTIRKYSSSDDYEKYTYIIYNFGNNPEYHSYMYEMIQRYPGYVILHDFILYYLTVGYYAQRNQLFQKIYELEGVDGIQIVKESLKRNESQDLLHHKDISAMLPMNKEIIEKAKGIFVHSEYSKKLVEQTCKNKNVSVIPFVEPLLFREKNKKIGKEYLYKKFKIKQNAYIIGSVGFIGPSKQNELVCKAVKEYNKQNKDKIYYIMIGEGAFVDDLLDEYIQKTGFLENESFFEAILSCDLIMNLRYPYNGEASGTLVQCMSLGIPCVVTDIGWFGELPNNSVIKVNKDITENSLTEIIQKAKENKFDKTAKNGSNYIKNICNASNIALKIKKFLK